LIVAVLDACVLYPPSLRDLLMRLAVVGAYAPRWTEQIHAEWIRAVLNDNPGLALAQLERTRRLMNLINPQSVVSGFEEQIATLRLPDPDDRHVLAAAIVAGASHIVTFNKTDFPEAAVRPFNIKIAGPDDFVGALFDDDVDVCLEAIREHRASLKNPAKTPTEYLATLRAGRLNEFAARLELFTGRF